MAVSYLMMMLLFIVIRLQYLHGDHISMILTELGEGGLIWDCGLLIEKKFSFSYQSFSKRGWSTLNAAVSLLMSAVWKVLLAVIVPTDKILVTFIITVTVSLPEGTRILSGTEIPVLIWSNPTGQHRSRSGGGSGRNLWFRIGNENLKDNFSHLDLQPPKQYSTLRSPLGQCNRFGSRWWSRLIHSWWLEAQSSFQKFSQPYGSHSLYLFSKGVSPHLIFWGSRNGTLYMHEPQSKWMSAVFSFLVPHVFFHSFSGFWDSCLLDSLRNSQHLHSCP